MGGGSSSMTSTNVQTKNIVDALVKSIQNCEGNTVINQRVTITGNFNVVKNVRLVQSMRLSSSCALNAKSVSDTQQAVANAIKQAADAQSDAITGQLGSSHASDSTSILNEVQTKMTSETIQNIVNNFNATQDFWLNGNSNIVSDITMDQSMQVLYEQCLTALTQLSSFQQATNTADQTAKTTQTNTFLEALGDIFANLGLMWVIVIVVIVAVGGYVLVKGSPFAALLGPGGAGGPMRPGMRRPGMPMMRPLAGPRMPYPQ